MRFRAWYPLNWMQYDVQKSLNFPEMLELPKFEIMQFTGLYDNNRKEIYEWDLLRIKDNYSQKYIIRDVRFVLWCYRCDGFELNEIRDKEMIWNRFENPDLIPHQ